jgi:putative colanic acid biosynthesis acetyltransferase WcaF
MPSARIWAPWNLAVGEEGALGEFVDCYNVAPIHIGAYATVSQHAHLCSATHDIHDPHMGLLRKEISIGAGAWVCAGAFIAMGVRVGEGAVCGARSVVIRDVPDWTVVAGNPARVINKRDLRP